MLVHGNQPEALRDLLVTWMRRYPLAPLEREIILAQSNGIAQWLKLALAADPSLGEGGEGVGNSRQGGGNNPVGGDDHRKGSDDSRQESGDSREAGGDGGKGEGDNQEGGLGIAAALEISLPSRFLWRVYRAVLGAEQVPETSPFDKSRLVWRLMRLLPEVLAQPDYAPLRRFLARDADLRKRFQLAERLADLFDQYQVYRADWLAAWAAGEDELIDARGQRKPLPAEQRWQAALWRALLADVRSDWGADLSSALGPDRLLRSQRQAGQAPAWPGGDPSAAFHPGRAAVHQAFLECAAAWPAGERPAGLPRRLLVFGISSLPRQSLEVLAALTRWTQILMCVHNPCEHYWADIVADKELLRARRHRQRPKAGHPLELPPEALHLHAHPLLAAWGKQGRDFIGLLDEHDDPAARGAYQDRFAALGQRIDLFMTPSGGARTLLAQLQDDIRDLRPLAETRERWSPLDPDRDASLRFHVAHGPQREVEILHDQLLAAFNADPSLTPRDVIVMVPDIDAYTPHIQAVFGLVERADPRYLPFSLADQGRRATDPLVQALANLLALPQSRLAVSDLLDLLEVPALRRRFGIDEAELPRLRAWVQGANIRWGLHAEQRASLELPDQPEGEAQHTWRFGLRRMLLGYALGAGEAWRGIEPFDEIGGLDAALLGPLVTLIDRLEATWRRLREPATVADWCARLRALLTDFFDPEDGGDRYTLLQLESALQEWEEACAEAGLQERLPLTIVGEQWLARLDEAHLSQRFFAGAVTFATLMPMRAIPFRLVCLLGMNDGDYPRQRPPMDFDLMGRDYRPGDRSRREDDRYLFLEALLSARERLHISWVGRSIRDNTPRPPSVLVGQLRDHLAAGWRLAGYQGPEAQARDALLAALTQEHALQPFSPRYFPAVGCPACHATSAFSPLSPALPHEGGGRRLEQPLTHFSQDCSDSRGSGGERTPESPHTYSPPPGGRGSGGGGEGLGPGEGAFCAQVQAQGDEPAEAPSPLAAPLGGWFTYAKEWRPQSPGEAAGPITSKSTGTGTGGILPPLAREEPLSLRDLADFLRVPVQAFFTQRLGVHFQLEDPASADQEPFALDHLQRWKLNDELIRTQALALERGESIELARTAGLERIRRRGDLPPAAFGTALAEELAAPMDDLFIRYRQALARWPQPVAEEEPIQFQAEVEGRVLKLADWLGGLRRAEDGGRARVLIEASDLVKDNHYRGEKLIRHWVSHLAGHLGGKPLTTRVLSKIGEVELSPMDPEQARQMLDRLLAAWSMGMQRPLPLAVETAFVWLRAGLVEKARQAYEGGYRTLGERDKDPWLARAYPDFESLTAGGDFGDWAEALLRPLWTAILADGQRSGSEGGQTKVKAQSEAGIEEART